MRAKAEKSSGDFTSPPEGGRSELLPVIPWLCYNLAGVDSTAKPEFAGDVAQPAKACDPLEVPSQAGRTPGLLDKQQGNEDVSRYCPVCSQRLESRRCKLICPVCGYYMSCADYY